MESITVEKAPPSARLRRRTKFLVGLAAFCGGLLITQVNHFNTAHDLAASYKGSLLLAGWALAAIAYLYARRQYREDELEILINRRALAFAVYAMLFGLLVLDGLQTAGLVPAFSWKNGQLVMLLTALMLGGMLFSKLRYR